MGKTYRMATQLEVRHYQELVRPITDYLDRHHPAGDRLPPEMKPFTEKISDELQRFGYHVTVSCLMVEIIDQWFHNLVLTPEQENATNADLDYLWEMLSVKKT